MIAGALLGVSIAVIAPARAGAQSPQPASPERAGFVTTLGRDTVALESFTRSARRIDGDVVVRIPGTVLCHYSIEFAADGTPQETRVDVQPLSAPSVQPERVTLDFANDSVRIVAESQGKRQTATHPLARGALPFFMTGFGPSYGLYTAVGPLELALAHLPSTIGDTTAVAAIDIANARSGVRRLVRHSPSEVDADWFGALWTQLTVNAANEITAVDARGTTEKTQTQRTAFIDVAAAAQRFAMVDRAGRGLGAASSDTVALGEIDGNRVVVTYGAPHARGRTILGAVVPYDQVWRTGANAATVLTVDHDLSIGGTKLPAGAYSLWTLPKRDGTVTLIINRQHGQWGTDYDPQQDLARVPMQVSAAATPRERFLIEVTGGGTPRLRLSWDTFIWSVPLR